MLSRSPSPTSSSRSSSPPLALDPNTLALLNNFYSERTQLEEEYAALEKKAQERLDAAKAGDAGEGGEARERMSVEEFRRLFGEDWQLSQFWYSTAFTRYLSHFISTLIPSTSTIAFISSPTGYVGFTSCQPTYAKVKLLEFDDRFGIVAGSDFTRWDLNHPLENIDHLRGTIDFVVVDPPFLNKVTNEQFAACLKEILAPGGKMLLLTSTSVQGLNEVYKGLLEEGMEELLETSERLQVSHAGGIANGFGSWLSWTPDKDLLEKALTWEDAEP